MGLRFFATKNRVGFGGRGCSTSFFFPSIAKSGRLAERWHDERSSGEEEAWRIKMGMTGAERQRKYREAHPEEKEKHRQRQQVYRKKSPEKYNEACKKTRIKRILERPIEARIAKRVASRKAKKTINGKIRKKKANQRRLRKFTYAMNHAARWKSEEIRLIFDREKTDRELCLLLDRSLSAISEARRRYADQAPAGWTTKTGFQRRGNIDLVEVQGKQPPR